MTGYRLLDSGEGRRLEALGEVRVSRTAPHAAWRRRTDDWAVDATHHRLASGGGRWEFHRALPESWPVELGDLTFRVQLTDFGHIGLFPEQLETWAFLRRTIEGCGRPIRVLNLFAYSGGSTLACAAGGAEEVVHVDASRGVVDWARANAERSGLGQAPIRWLVEDVRKFVAREIRRGRTYDGLVLDPPTYGRGKKGEVWRIEEDLVALLADLGRLLSDAPLFVNLSCHSPGYTPAVLENILSDRLGEPFGRLDAGEMTIDEAGRRRFPTGVFCRAWSESS